MLHNLAERIVVSGALVSVATICLIQYLYFVSRMSKQRNKIDDYDKHLKWLESELTVIKRDRSIARMEIEILSEFVAQAEFDKALSNILRHYVPDSRKELCAVLEVQDGGHRVVQSKGLDPESLAALTIDPQLIDRVLNSSTVTLTGSDLHDSLLLRKLSAADRGKVRELYVVPIRGGDNLAGLLITSNLYPADALRRNQLELVSRLMQSVAIHLDRSRQDLEQQQQLETARQILDLRSIADREYRNPLEMVEDFLAALATTLKTDRATLYTFGQHSRQQHSQVLKCGKPQQPGIESQWSLHESRLAQSALISSEIQFFDESQLRAMGISTLVRTAVVAPLTCSPDAVNVICLTQQHAADNLKSNRALLDWAFEFLSEAIRRALNQVRVELQANQDGLTELANRRAFDERVRVEFKRSEHKNSPCSLLLCDLDRFKLINDSYGHQAGDEVLRSVSRTIRAQVEGIRDFDRALIARYGGEELAVLLPEMPAKGAERVAESIRSAVEQLVISYQGHHIPVTISIGLASFPSHIQSTKDMIAGADAALYRAKSAGRNRVCCGSLAESHV